MKELLNKVVRGEDLTRDETRDAFDRIMSGQVSEVEIAGLLTALACKGETVDEIVGAAEAMRAKVTPVRCDDQDAIDTCGTGGDGISTFNISTAAGILGAAAGATVAKHGNRTNTRVSGSAEALAALGVNIEADVPCVEACIRETRIGFLFAFKLHPAMKYAGPVRKTLGVRTIYNVLGPLTNPAGVRRQVMGVSRPELTETIAEVLGGLGAAHAMVVHGLDGLCDLTITGPSRVSTWRAGKIETTTVKPEQVGLSRGKLDDLLVTSPGESAEAIRRVFAGEQGPRRDVVLLNAAAALVVAGKAGELRDGIDQAARAIDDGRATETLTSLAAISQAH